MKIFRKTLAVILLVILCGCSKEKVKESIIIEKNLEEQVIDAYQEGKKSLEKGDVLFAAKKFQEAEILFPQSQLAPKSALLSAYSYYKQDYYADAIDELLRFIRIYPKNSNLDYAYYLLAICYYEQIVDEKKDLNSIEKAKKTFEFILEEFPNSEYALDGEFKLDLINDILASKEMYIGRYYFDKKKWIASINRFRTVIDVYDNTIYTEEALHRLVEAYYTIGLTEEAKKYAKVLGYNYLSSDWYKKSYSFFNSNYIDEEISKQIKKKNNKLTDKFKSLFE